MKIHPKVVSRRTGKKTCLQPIAPFPIYQFSTPTKVQVKEADHTMKTYRGSGNEVLCINLGTRWSWADSFMFQPLYPYRCKIKSRWYRLILCLQWQALK